MSLRRIALALVLAFAPLPAWAQTGGSAPAAAYREPDLAAQRAAIARLSALSGRWQGEARVSFPAPMQVFQSEQVGAELDGLVLVVRGLGHADAARSTPVFSALGLISYNDMSGAYEVRAYSQGRATTARGEFLQDGVFRWSFEPGGPVRIRYTIVFDASTWRETGEMSRDNGATWTETVSMTLTRME